MLQETILQAAEFIADQVKARKYKFSRSSVSFTLNYYLRNSFLPENLWEHHSAIVEAAAKFQNK